MPYGFNFAGLFARFGEVTVTRSLLGIAQYIDREFGVEGFNIRMINMVRKKYGLRSQGEASALIKDIRDNVNAARQLQETLPEDAIRSDEFPVSSNPLGGEEGTDLFVVSGVADIVDQDGDVIRRIPFVVEGNQLDTHQQLMNTIGEDLHGFIDKYMEELIDAEGGTLSIGKISYNFVGKRGG